MSIAYCKAKQSASQAKKNPIVCSLFEACAKSVQDYNFEEQHGLKSGLVDDHSLYAFAQLLPDNPPEEFVSTPFGCTPKGSILSYQALEYKKPQEHGSTEETSQEFPALPIGILNNAPCIFEIESEEQCTKLSKITITLDEAHSLKRSTCEQSQSTKWQQSRVRRVIASRFGYVLLRQSLPSESFINSFFNNKEYTTMPVQINHGIKNEVKARNAHCCRTCFTVHKCGLVVNPSVPWLGASPDGLVKDLAEQNSFDLLEILYTALLYSGRCLQRLKLLC